MLSRHEHPNLDVEGVWNQRDCKFIILFPVTESERYEDITSKESRRVRELMERAGSLLANPTVKLESLEAPTATRAHSLQIMEEELTFPSSGLMVIKGRYFKPVQQGEDRLRECVDIVADIFADRMFERPDNSFA